MTSSGFHEKILNFLYSFIAGVALAASVVVLAFAVKVFTPDWQRIAFVFAVVFVPLISQVFGALALEAGWFREAKNPGALINAMHWVSGIFGVAAVFDLTMRLTRQTAWMMTGRAPFVVDGIFILLFLLWMLTSHFINRDARENNACRYC